MLLERIPGRSTRPTTGRRRLQRKMLLHVPLPSRAVFSMKDEMCCALGHGASVEMLDAGCCGMAGSFGFERRELRVSQTLGERALLPAVRAAAADDRDRHRRIQLPRADRAEHRPARCSSGGGAGGACIAMIMIRSIRS